MNDRGKQCILMCSPVFWVRWIMWWSKCNILCLGVSPQSSSNLLEVPKKDWLLVCKGQIKTISNFIYLYSQKHSREERMYFFIAFLEFCSHIDIHTVWYQNKNSLYDLMAIKKLYTFMISEWYLVLEIVWKRLDIKEMENINSFPL